ncbi:MAG: hypothetical protein JNL30_17695 [Rubrivivax sp.]|nr:hypothetical protein [Rubrivivax sp.]
MNQAPPLERFLAQLYADPAALESYLAAPDAFVAQAGLDAEEATALRDADLVGLVMAARSCARKRGGRHEPR